MLKGFQFGFLFVFQFCIFSIPVFFKICRASLENVFQIYMGNRF